MMGNAEPSGTMSQRVRAVTGRQPVGWSRVTKGYTPAERWTVRFDDGSSAFVKAGVTEDTAGWLRKEHDIYERLAGAPFLAELRGWDDDGETPLLLLEDLSGAQWPPPWTGARIDAVLAALDAVHASSPPVTVTLEEDRADMAGWWKIAEDPEPFLSTGNCTAAWLEHALPSLLEAERNAVLEGDALVHFDVRSDNLCFTQGRAVLVDWNWASLGNPKVDAVSWMPSLRLEGGPPPETVIAAEPELAAFVCGFLACRAGLPDLPQAPRVRTVQRAQLRVALPWAAALLGLPPPGRPGRLS